jgi:hypothetical protein
MTWYINTCGSIGHGLTIHVSLMVKCVCYTGLWIHWFRDLGVTIFNSLITTGRTSLVGRPLEVGLNRATNVMYGMLCNDWGIGIVL